MKKGAKKSVKTRRFSAKIALTVSVAVVVATVGLLFVNDRLLAKKPTMGGTIANSLPPGQQPWGYRSQPVICPDQSDICVDKLISDMNKQYNALACNHNAVFSLLYLRTTEGINKAIDAGEFQDKAKWNQVTTAFGVYYLDALKDWQKGKGSRVPEAWRIAFEASHNKQVSTLGDIYLSINAHINRDLAFVYYQLGVENYNDHLHVNTVLGRTRPVAFPDINNNLDNTLFTQVPPAGLDLDIFAWRALAWENAQRLAAAPDATARAVIAKEIEAHAVEKAQQIKAAFPVTAAANQARDAFCAQKRL